MFSAKSKRILTHLACFICLLALSSRVGILFAGQHPAELVTARHALYRGDFSKAASLAEVYVKSHPSSVEGLSLLARAELAQGKYQRSFDTLRKALQSAPQDTDVLYYLSRVSTILAQQQFQRLRQLAPNSVRVHQLLAESYLARGDTSGAAAEYKKGLKLDPRSIELLVAMGNLERSEFHFKQATEYYSRVLRINPQNYAGAYGMGASYLFLQEPGKAIPYFRKAIAVSPGSAVAHFGLGDALLRSGEVRPSLKELKEAVRLEPRMRQAFTLLARAYRKLGMEEDAKRALAESQRLAQEEIKSRQETINNESSPKSTAK